MNAEAETFAVRAHELVSRVQSIATDSPDARDVVPTLRELVQLIEATPERRDQAIQLFLELLNPRQGWLPLWAPGDIEIVEFCMHESRLTPVRDALLALRSSSNDPRVSEVAERALEAFDDVWELGDIYARPDGS